MSDQPRAGFSRWARIAMQTFFFAAGLGLLAWVLSQAFAERNRDAWRRIADASAVDLAALAGLTMLTLVLNGSIFWATLRPVRRLGWKDVLATNAVATTLAYLPFKLSIVFRVLVHNRRDGVPVLTVGAWFVAVTIGISAATNPVFFTSLFHPTIDLWWFLFVLGGLIASHVVVCSLARIFAGSAGLERFRNVLAKLTPKRLAPTVTGPLAAKVHAGFDMLAHPGWLAAQMALRAADLLVIAARLALCAKIAGAGVTFGESIVYGAFRFAIATLLPSGAMGSQEAGTTWIARVRQAAAADKFEVVLVFMLLSELVIFVLAAAWGAWRLRVHRLAQGPATGGTLPSP